MHHIIPEVEGADLADGADVCDTIWAFGVAQHPRDSVGVRVDREEETPLWLALEVPEYALLHLQPAIVDA